MWIKLGHEYLNLDQVARVRISTGWKNGREETVAEVESIVNGALQGLTRYRGPEAVVLQAVLANCNIGQHLPATVTAEAAPPPPRPVGASHRDTMHDM